MGRISHFLLMHMFVSDIKKEGVLDQLVLFSMIRKSFFKLLFLILPMFLHKGHILLFFFTFIIQIQG